MTALLFGLWWMVACLNFHIVGRLVRANIVEPAGSYNGGGTAALLIVSIVAALVMLLGLITATFYIRACETET